MKELTKEEVDKVQEEAGGLDVVHLKVRGLGSVVVCPPTRGDLARFQARARGDARRKTNGDLPGALEELARCCVVYPKLVDLDAAIEAARKHGAWLAIGNAAVDLSGAGAEEVLGN